MAHPLWSATPSEVVRCRSIRLPAARTQTIDRTTPFAQLPEWLSTEEVAAILGIDRWSVYSHIRQGLIPHRRFGKRYLIPKSYVDPATRRRQ
jgi:excisionase family DNA binding protein